MDERLKRLDLTVTQCAYWLEMEPQMVNEALGAETCPQWLDYCLAMMIRELEDDPDAFQFCKIGGDLAGDTWTARTARAAVPILIEQARKRELISYGDLDAELRRRDPARGSAGTLQKYARPLGLIGRVVEELRDEARDSTSFVPEHYATLPPIEAIVVRGREQVPGTGIDYFLESYLKVSGHPDPSGALKLGRERMVREIQQSIFDWEDWGVLSNLAATWAK